LRDAYLLQYVTKPTRVRSSDNPHILDLVLSNIDIISDINYLSPLGKSDHSVLLVKLMDSMEEKQIFTKLNYNKGDYESMKERVEA
jgi:hypothetical protein